MTTRYEVLGLLGEGSFGRVLLAQAIGAGGFQKRVALKVLHPESRSPERLEMLRDEARMLGLVSHRAIVGVDTLLEFPEGWTVVMEYVAGQDLSALLREHTLPESVIVELLAEVAAALHVAFHTRSESGELLALVHRDLKPANIRVTPFGEVKILDFGVASAQFVGREAGQGLRMGTPGFLAPERLKGEPSGAKGDVFALGCVLLRIFGRVWRPVSPSEHARAVAQVCQGLSPEWTALLAQMLAFSPQARPTPAELEAALWEIPVDGPRLRTWATAAVQVQAAQPPTEPTLMTAVLNPAQGRGNLSAPKDRFFGRQDELEALAAVLRSTPLLQITGLGGMGKTRMALELGASQEGFFAGGVWFIDLSTCHGEGAVAEQILLVLGNKPGGRPVDQVLEHLGGRAQLLLVLDNAEQLHGAIEDFVCALSGSHPLGHHVLLTSRLRHALPAAHTHALDPLAVGGAALFADRATLADPAFDPEAHSEAITRLVERLDHLPLAIELAASRVRILSPQEILSRLDRRFQVLRATTAERPSRHQTLEMSLDGTWELLTGPQRDVACQLVVFEGSFSSALVEAVVRVEPLWVLDVLQELQELGLVRRVGDGRMRLLVSVRAYLRRHTEPSVALMERLAQGLEQVHRYPACFSPEGIIALGADRANLFAAFDDADARGDAAALYAVYLPLQRLLINFGPLARVRELAQRALVHIQVPARRVDVEGHLLVLRRREDFERVLEAAVGVADPTVVARIQLMYAGFLPGDARQALRSAVLEDARARGDRVAIGRALAGMGFYAEWTGELDRAHALLHEALQVKESLGEIINTAGIHRSLAKVYCATGELDQAQLSCDRVYALGRRCRAPGPALMIGPVQCTLHWLKGEDEAAYRTARAALELCRSTGQGGTLRQSRVHVSYVQACLATQRLPEARRMASASVAADTETGRLLAWSAAVELLLADTPLPDQFAEALRRIEESEVQRGGELSFIRALHLVALKQTGQVVLPEQVAQLIQAPYPAWKPHILHLLALLYAPADPERHRLVQQATESVEALGIPQRSWLRRRLHGLTLAEGSG